MTCPNSQHNTTADTQCYSSR